VVDLLPDRAAESFSAWLQQHPGVLTIARDRCGLHAEGAALGAPHAQQIADRFHLILNLSATMERVLEERSRQLVLPPSDGPAASAQPTPGDLSADSPSPASLPPTQSQLRRQRRLERYQQVVALSRTGQSQAAISRALGMERKTVRRWLRRGEFPECKPPHRRPPKVNAFAEYLQQRWHEGCHNASRLYQEIRVKGYAGKRAMVARLVAGWRKTGKASSPQTPERISPKHAAILVTRAANSGPMQRWVEGAKHCEYGAVVRFAYGLQKDTSAVSAAVDTAWSTGQVEGQINRLKTIKRQMYGRAGFALLHARVLSYGPALAAGPAP